MAKSEKNPEFDLAALYAELQRCSDAQNYERGLKTTEQSMKSFICHIGPK